MNEKPLERLNYYNGRPLEAADLKTEQEYHIRTRRWLNKSLYTAGIGRGLEVKAVPPDPNKIEPPQVAVSPGLALDSEGREIILLEEAVVEVCSYAGQEGGEDTVVGNYLVIEYAEEMLAYEKGGCAVRTAGTSARKSTSHWGGPSRIEAKPKFSWAPFVPQPGSNKIVLARVELKDGCKEVGQIDTGARRYVGAASAATVRQYALEGEREVAFIPKESFPSPKPNEDMYVVGRVYFHIRGRQPNSVTLYLKAEQFSSLYYTELGTHSHPSSGISTSQIKTEAEDTAFPTIGVGSDGGLHTHNIEGLIQENQEYDPQPGIPGWNRCRGFVLGKPVEKDNGRARLWPLSGSTDGNLFLDRNNPSTHQHTIIDVNTGATFNSYTHKHAVNLSILPVGVSARAREGDPLTFIDDLQVSIGPIGSLINRTQAIREQVADRNPNDWRISQTEIRKLGDGTRNHVVADKGTGPIRLDFLPGLSFAGGEEYCIELRVDAKTAAGVRVSNGGKVLYNLYIE